MLTLYSSLSRDNWREIDNLGEVGINTEGS